MERSQASRYLDLPAEAAGKSFKRSLWLLWMPLLMVPELFVAVIAVIGHRPHSREWRCGRLSQATLR